MDITLDKKIPIPTRLKPKVTRVKLTAEQKESLSEVFGKDVVARIDSLQINEVEGFVSGVIVIN